MIWNPGNGLPFPRTNASVPQPADTLLMFEKNQGAGVTGWPYPKTRKPGSNWDNGGAFENWQETAWERHGDRLNALFADGHVKGMKHERFWEILPHYTNHYGLTRDVYRHFWPYE